MEEHIKDNSKILWKAIPSQWVNLFNFTLCGLTFFLIFPIFYALWLYLVVKNEKYELTENVLNLYSGVINKKIDDVELYRIKDIRLERPLLLRFFGLGNIYIISSDQTNPHITLKAIKNSEKVRKGLRTLVEKARQARGVREIDGFN